MTHRARLATAGAVLVAVAAPIALAGCGGSSKASSKGTSVPVTEGAPKEFSLVPASRSLRVGDVTFDVKNAGKVTHEMIVVPASSPQSLRKPNGEADESKSAGEAADIAPGKSKSVTVNLKKGTYVLLCNQPGHFAAGMASTVTVR